ncbi:hypothetical protein RJ641_030686 [Dillenia turbinata]|uniref:Uncharacterized protein n=1 Tax=Dillenia turbinata TaxID=194707 RepID=A0AAN8VWD6_9MAGN
MKSSALAAVAAQSNVRHELKETLSVPKVQEQNAIGKKKAASLPLSMIIKVKPQAKRAKMDAQCVEEHSDAAEKTLNGREKSLNSGKTSDDDSDTNVVKTGLVSYSDESEDDD